jgi:sn-glycerol 3-phosphate transport system ATP-binding protein
MTVKGNMEFGLINNKIPKEEINRRVKEISGIVGLTSYLDRKPQSLSGGQRQRVALARAMVKQPSVFLMDEPLSKLDAKLRSQIRTDLIELHNRLKTTFVYVTHDQIEAMSMGTSIVLLKDGEIMQQDTPYNIYNNPQNVFTAQFIGTPPMNILDRDKLNNITIPENISYIGFRPEDATIIQNQEIEANDDIIIIPGKIATKEMLGAESLYKLDAVG